VVHATRDLLSMPLVRIGSGVLLGLIALGLFAGTVAARDAGLQWLVLDVVLITAGAAIVAVGFGVLRDIHERSALVRGWVTIGAAVLLLLTLFLGLD
jgi:hypothetical protein